MPKIQFFLGKSKGAGFEVKRPMIVEEGKVQSNYTENDPQAPSHILNRPFYSETVTEPFEITWDGAWGGRDVLMLEEGAVFVRVSDRVFTVDELEGCFVTANGVFGEDTFQPTSQEMEVEGYKAIALLYNNIPFVLINPEDVYDADSGLSAPKGTWFIKAFSGDSYAFTSSLQFPSLTYEKIYKLDNKFVDSEWMATTEIGTGKKVFKAQDFYEAVMAGTIVDGVEGVLLLQIDTRFYTAEELSKTTLTMTIGGVEVTIATLSAFEDELEGIRSVVAKFVIVFEEVEVLLLSFEQSMGASYAEGLYIGINGSEITEATDITLTINGVSGLEVPNKLPNKFLDLDWIPKSRVVPREVFSGVTSATEEIDYIPALSDPNTIVAMEIDGIVHEVAATTDGAVMLWGVGNLLTNDFVYLACVGQSCVLYSTVTSPITVTVYENVADPIPSYFLPEGVGLISYIHVETSPDQSAFGDVGVEIFQAYMNGGTVVLSYADADETHLRLLMCRAVDRGIQNASAIDQYGDYWVLKGSAWKKVLLANPNFSTGTPSLLWSLGVNAPFRPTALNSTLTEGSTLPAQEGAVFTAIQNLENTIGTLNQDLENRLNGGT